MHTVNIRGKQNPKDSKMVKLEMIFFKTGYARVPKVLNVTGLVKDWDAKAQCFKPGSTEASVKNKILFDTKNKYLHTADIWESEERCWSPIELSHCFDAIKQPKQEEKVKTVLQTIDSLEAYFMEKKRIKNGEIIVSINNDSISSENASLIALSRASAAFRN